MRVRARLAFAIAGGLRAGGRLRRCFPRSRVGAGRVVAVAAGAAEYVANTFSPSIVATGEKAGKRDELDRLSRV